MDMFPHTVTLYLLRRETDRESFQVRTAWKAAVLRGVLLRESPESRERSEGPEQTGSASLLIPLTVRAEDGRTGRELRYLAPAAYERLPDRSGFWTAEAGPGCFFVSGLALPEEDWPAEKLRQLLEERYGGVYGVSKAELRDYGGLGHLTLTGV